MKERADKFLFVVRLAKTRSDAAELLRQGKVLVNGVMVKPSRDIVVGDVLMVKHPPAVFSYRVKELTDKRVGAKLVATYIDDITPIEEIEKLELARLDTSGRRERGAGRPTKRERRDLDDFLAE